jgi:hypothetical protein
MGLVSNIKLNYDEMFKCMMDDAINISSKSPVGIWANKRVILYIYIFLGAD